MKMLITILVLVLLFSLGSFAQTQQAELNPTEVETLRLQNAQKDAIIAQAAIEQMKLQLSIAERNFKDKLNGLQAQAEQVKSAHKWDADFEPTTLKFTHKPVPPKK